MMTMQTAVALVQHAPGTPGKAHQALTGSTGHAERSAQQTYSTEAVMAMTLVGFIGIGAVVLFALACGALLRKITTKRQQPGSNREGDTVSVNKACECQSSICAETIGHVPSQCTMEQPLVTFDVGGSMKTICAACIQFRRDRFAQLAQRVQHNGNTQ